MKHKLSSAQRGFTIIELMIATSVFSVILVIVSIVMIGIGNLFQKGINQARVQDNVRSISDQLAQDLKLNQNFVTADYDATNSPIKLNGNNKVPVTVYCVGGVRYTAMTGHKLGANGSKDTDGTTLLSPHVLWRDTYNGSCLPADLSATNPNTVTPIIGVTGQGANGVELIADNSRLTAFCIGNYNPGPPTCSPAATSSYALTVGVAYGDIDLLSNPNASNARCRGDVGGDQFCSTASLQTTVVQRLR